MVDKGSSKHLDESGIKVDSEVKLVSYVAVSAPRLIPYTQS